MVCVYCGNKTIVTNSRLQKQLNKVWRRRECPSCHAVFSTLEHVIYENVLALQKGTSHIIPFQREKLFLSIYNSCRHRPNAISDAVALTDTVMGKVVDRQQNHTGLLLRDKLVKTTSETLKQFDNVAYTYYLAYHSL